MAPVIGNECTTLRDEHGYCINAIYCTTNGQGKHNNITVGTRGCKDERICCRDQDLVNALDLIIKNKLARPGVCGVSESNNMVYLTRNDEFPWTVQLKYFYSNKPI